ncbi:hypothetical protein ACFLRH_02675 [Actinomycetota bacterium]
MRQTVATGAAVLLLAAVPACDDSAPDQAFTGTSPTTAAAPSASSAAPPADPGTTSSTTAPATPAAGPFSFVQVADDTEQVLIELSFPVLSHPSASQAAPINDKINAAVDKIVDAFAQAAGAAPPGESRPTLSLQAAPELINDEVFSVGGIVFEFVPGGTPATKRLAWIFAIKTGELISATDLFVDGDLEHLAAAAREHLITDALGDAAAITSPEGLLPTPTNFDAVWLTADGVGVGFDQYQVTGDARSPTVLVPFAELLDTLATTGVLAPLQDGTTLPEL